MLANLTRTELQKLISRVADIEASDVLRPNSRAGFTVADHEVSELRRLALEAQGILTSRASVESLLSKYEGAAKLPLVLEPKTIGRTYPDRADDVAILNGFESGPCAVTVTVDVDGATQAITYRGSPVFFIPRAHWDAFKPSQSFQASLDSGAIVPVLDSKELLADPWAVVKTLRMRPGRAHPVWRQLVSALANGRRELAAQWLEVEEKRTKDTLQGNRLTHLKTLLPEAAE